MLFALVELVVICSSQFSKLKKNVYKKMQFACSPFKVGILLIYMGLCFAPANMFDSENSYSMSQSICLVINIAGSLVLLMFGITAVC